jgi:hypothetical protein
MGFAAQKYIISQSHSFASFNLMGLSNKSHLFSFSSHFAGKKN